MIPACFASPEDNLLVAILQHRDEAEFLPLFSEGLAQGVTWQRLQQSVIAFPWLYPALQVVAQDLSVPDSVLTRARKVYQFTRAANGFRLAMVQRLFQTATQHGIPLLLLKGAADIIDNASDETFLANRVMRDIDFLCLMQDVPALDRVLQSQGNKLHQYFREGLNAEEIHRVSLEEMGHYCYNYGQFNHLEMHAEIAVGENIASYPLEFAKALWEQAQTVSLEGVSVRIPKPEHRLVYLICHEASLKDQWQMIKQYTHALDAVDAAPGYWQQDKIRARFDAQQLRFLMRLQAFLKVYGPKLDMQEVAKLLDTVPAQEWLTLYLDLAVAVLSEDFNPLGRPLKPLAKIYQDRNGKINRAIQREQWNSSVKSLLETVKGGVLAGLQKYCGLRGIH